MDYDLEVAEVWLIAGLVQRPFPPGTRKEWDRLLDLLLRGRQFRRFFGASLVLLSAPEKIPVNSTGKSALNRALQLMHRAIEEGRLALQRLR